MGRLSASAILPSRARSSVHRLLAARQASLSSSAIPCSGTLSFACPVSVPSRSTLTLEPSEREREELLTEPFLASAMAAWETPWWSRG